MRAGPPRRRAPRALISERHTGALVAGSGAGLLHRHLRRLLDSPHGLRFSDGLAPSRPAQPTLETATVGSPVPRSAPMEKHFHEITGEFPYQRTSQQN